MSTVFMASQGITLIKMKLLGVERHEEQESASVDLSHGDVLSEFKIVLAGDALRSVW